MARYMMVYFGGDAPSSPEEGKARYDDYQHWLKSLGNRIAEPMVPFKETHTLELLSGVTKGSTSAMSGYTILNAENIEEAIKIAQGCPFLEINGRLEVSELP